MIRRAAAFLLTLLTAASALAGDVAFQVRTPARGSDERGAMMDAIRSGMHSSTIFIVDHLRVAASDGFAVGYAEVRPARPNAAEPFTGWVFLVRGHGPWRASWGVNSDGMESCRLIRIAYDSAYSAAKPTGAADRLFSASFLAERRTLAKRDPDLGCVGDLVIGPDL